jgi:DNA-binding response OmpR family regulator
MCLFPPTRLPGLLVIHDDPRVLSVLCALIKLEGFAAHRAANVHAALACLRGSAGEIGAALIDVDKTSGAEACGLLRAAAPGLRCWLMSSATTVQGACVQGAEGVLAKPFTLAALRGCLEAMRPRGAASAAG